MNDPAEFAAPVACASCGVLESDNAGERNQMPELEEFARLRGRFAEAMKYRAQFARPVRAQKRERIVPGVAFVNDHIQAEFDCEIELLLEDARLRALSARRRAIAAVGSMRSLSGVSESGASLARGGEPGSRW